jgi:hypothetical protein
MLDLTSAQAVVRLSTVRRLSPSEVIGREHEAADVLRYLTLPPAPLQVSGPQGHQQHLISAAAMVRISAAAMGQAIDEDVLPPQWAIRACGYARSGSLVAR